MNKKNPVLQFTSIADGRQVHEKIVEQIRQAIFEKQILPGERLQSERELAETFNTSRVTVRSAILTLRNSGLLHVRKGTGGGTFVVEDLDEAVISGILRDIIRWKEISIEHVIQMRGIIEPHVAYLAAKNAEEQDIQNIWSTIRELDRSFKKKATFQSQDEKFHKALATAAGNPLLSVFQASLIDLLFKFISSIAWKEEDKKGIIHHHERIAMKVEEHDPKGARTAMLEHLTDMRDRFSSYPMKDVLE
jgi:GntR family transcriptional repressor for pyruvate dehydrogenase complex